MHTLLKRKKLVAKSNGSFIPLFSPHEVSRDSFFRIRKELLALGCPQEQIVSIAQKLSVSVLELDSLSSYKRYIFQDTLKRCAEKISNGCQHLPEQDPDSDDYSHIELFSSVYNFELDYYRDADDSSNFADLGCGEGIFVSLMKNILNKEIHGYDIKLCEYNSLPNIHQINQIKDIPPVYTHLTMNHVLEHVLEHPINFLDQLLAHFNSGSSQLNTLILSLPMHSCLHSHETAGHRWYFTEKQIDPSFEAKLEQHGLKKVSLKDESRSLFDKYGYSCHYVSNLGLYFCQKEGAAS